MASSKNVSDSRPSTSSTLPERAPMVSMRAYTGSNTPLSDTACARLFGADRSSMASRAPSSCPLRARWSTMDTASFMAVSVSMPEAT